MAIGRLSLRAEDIWAAPEDGDRYEVVDGELAVNPPPNFAHQFLLSNLHYGLSAYVRPRRLGILLWNPGVVLDEYTGVEPDLVFLGANRIHLVSERGIEGAPTLIIEALSPSSLRLDRIVKLQRYARAGVPHYWIAATAERRIETYRLAGADYELVAAFGPGESLTSELFPGLSLEINSLWPVSPR